MANVNTTTVNSQFQLFFSKSLLREANPLAPDGAVCPKGSVSDENWRQ
jgi:hypothetical protein